MAKSIKLTGYVAFLMAVTSVSVPAAAAVDPLGLVPATAWGAVVINDISKLSKAVDGYAALLGKPPVNIEAEWLKKLGMGSGVVTTKPAVVVIMDANLYGAQPIAVLLPVKDFQASAKMIKAKATETPGIMQGENAEFGTAFIAKKGSYMIIAPTEDIVKSVMLSKESLSGSLSKGARAMIGSSDAFVHVNLQVLANVAKPYLMMASMMGGMGGMAGMAPGAGGPSGDKGAADMQMQAMQNLSKMAMVAADLLDQLTSFDLGLNLKSDTIKSTCLLGYRPGSELASLAEMQKPTGQPLLKGLPDSNSCLSFGFRWQPKLIKLYTAMIEMTPPGLTAADAQKYVKLAKENATMMTGAAASLSLQAPGPGTGMLRMRYVSETTDAKKCAANVRALLELQSKAGITGPDGKKISMDAKYEAGVATIAGVSVDRYTMDMSSILNMPGMSGGQSAGVLAGLTMMLGATDGKISTRIAQVSDKVIVTGFGLDDKAFAELIKSAKAGLAPLNSKPKYVKAGAMLSKNRIAEGYLDIGAAITGMMGGMMPPVGAAQSGATPAMLKIDIPLIAFGESLDAGAAKVEMVIPLEVIKQIAPMAEMLKGGMMQGMMQGMMGGTTQNVK